MDLASATFIKGFDLHEYLVSRLQLSSAPDITRSEESILTDHPAFKDSWLSPVAFNFFFNAKLWALEDKARDPAAMEYEITAVKRCIDRMNQQRNDYIEQINLFILGQLPSGPKTAPIYSESPGSIIDRLAILELRIKSVRELMKNNQLEYPDIQDLGRKLSSLLEAREDLRHSLLAIPKLLEQGVIQLKFYGIHKLYNHTRFNPYLRRSLELAK